MADVIKSYLVSLSASVDKASFDKFQTAMKGLESTVGKTVSGTLGSFLKFQIAGTTAFATVGFGIIAYIDKLAMADQQTKLLATQNMMSTQQYRAVSSALDILGVSLNDVFFGTKELQDRFHILIDDQKTLAAMLGPGYEKQQEQVRDVIFQLQRLELKGQYFGMKFASDLLRKLGFGDGGILKQLQNLNDFVMQKMPGWSDELSTDIIPIFNDFVDIMAGLGDLAKTTAVDFTKLVGTLSGDKGLENSTGDFKDFAKAIADTVHWLGELLKLATHFEGSELKDLQGLIHYGRSFEALAHGDLSGWRRERDLGNASESATHSTETHAMPASSGLRQQLFPNAMQPPPSIQQGGYFQNIADAVGKLTGVSAALIYGQMATETGNFKHLAGKNNLSGIKIPGTNTFKDFATPGDYEKYYANVLNESRYVNNGVRNARTGPEYAAALKTKSGTYYGTDSQNDYGRNVDKFSKQYASQVTIGSIQINSSPSFSPEQHAAAIRQGVKEGLDEHTRQLIAETNGAFQ